MDLVLSVVLKDKVMAYLKKFPHEQVDETIQILNSLQGDADNVLLPQEFGQQILNGLKMRPYMEVEGMILELLNLPSSE